MTPKLLTLAMIFASALGANAADGGSSAADAAVATDAGRAIAADAGPAVATDAGRAIAADAGPAVATDAGRAIAADAGLSVATDAGRAATLPPPGEWPDTDASRDVVDSLLQEGRFTHFLKLVAEANLGETLKGPGPFTLFVPSDDALAKLKSKENAKLLADKEALRRWVLMYVIPGRVHLAELRKLKSGDRIPTFNPSKKLKLSFKKDRVILDRAALVKPDLEASNGVVHELDGVLAP